MKIITKINTYTMEKIEKTKSWFFKKTTKIDRSLKKIDQIRIQIQK